MESGWVLYFDCFRDISSYMKKHNVVGSSTGYVERVCTSYSSVDLKMVGNTT